MIPLTVYAKVKSPPVPSCYTLVYVFADQVTLLSLRISMGADVQWVVPGFPFRAQFLEYNS